MPVTWRLNRPCHCTVPRQASAAGDGKSCQRSQTRRWPARQDCQCPAVRPVPECPPLPAEDRRQCRHSQSFRKMAACHPAGVPACRSPAVQQYRSPPGKHGQVVCLRPCTRPFQPASRERQAVPAVAVPKGLLRPSHARARKRKPAHRRAPEAAAH